MYYGPVLNVQNAGPGKTALITPGLGATYDKFILKLAGGLTAADLTAIRIKANDEEFFYDTGTNLDKRQAYQGVDTDVAEVCIDFTEPNARGDAAAQYLASLPANLLKKLQIEVDIADAEGAEEDFSQLTVAAEYRGPTQNRFILKRRPFNFYAGAAGDHDLLLPSGFSGGIIKRVWLHGASITAAQLKLGNSIAMDYKAIAELTRVQERNGLTPQTNIRCLDFVADGNLMGALDTSKQRGVDISLKLTTSGAVSIAGFIDYIDPIDRIRS